MRAIGYQKGDITYDLRERPSITFDVKQISYTADQKQPSTPTPAPAPISAPAPAPEEGAP